MKCLVTGAAGFIGSYIVDQLLNEDHNVLGVDDLSTGRLSNLSKASKSKSFAFINKSIIDLTVDDIGLSVDWVFHLAGRADLIPSIKNPDDYFSVNVDGTFRILELSKKLRCSRFVYSASSTCYGIPEQCPTTENAICSAEHPYGLTKMIGEQLVMHWSKIYNIPAISLRLFNVYGPRSRTTGAYGAVFGVFLKQKLEKQPFTVVGNGEQTRDFTYVTDVANAFICAAESSKTGEIYNVGSGNTYSINYLVELLGGKVIYIPKRPGEPDSTFADTSKITNDLKWKPIISLEDGVGIMLKCIDLWQDAPLWNKDSISEATKDWFEYLTPKQN